MTSNHDSGRGNAAWATKALGLPRRTVQDMAAKGEIPSAALIRRRWTFDKAKLHGFIADKEAEVARRTCIRPMLLPSNSARMPSGLGLRKAARAGPSLTEMIRQSRFEAKQRADAGRWTGSKQRGDYG